MTDVWLPIRYRDFYDVPRAIVIEREGDLFLLDCRFDSETDDYEANYAVYKLPAELHDDIDRISWTDLGHRGQRVGSVPTDAVEFDPTKRRAVSDRFFEAL
ncbi:MAG: hypothetical protein QOF28_760 [Actinomycetota bacterium]|jgi:hypothetical protein|nr:hypothetical protein [Actinomycetota bacterium]